MMTKAVKLHFDMRKSEFFQVRAMSFWHNKYMMAFVTPLD
jgi:hypothetical protein